MERFNPDLNRAEATQVEGVVDPKLIDEWNDCGYTIEKFGEDCSVVMLGEFHNDSDIKEKQIELIKAINPQYVLYESLNGWQYDPSTKEYTKIEGRDFLEGYEDEYFNKTGHGENPKESTQNHLAKKIVDTADEIGFKVIGCDLTLAEQAKVAQNIAILHPDEYTYDPEFHVLEKKKDPDYVFTGTVPEAVSARDVKMVEIIVEYQKKSDRPIVVIVGANHGNHIHEQGMLKESGFGYVYINQTRSTK
ncbi:MAG: ChaN family lipoprotein [Chlamydiae bacterium]|nr:ChaN family lipoprotein [Chlamydiota bacterium]